MSDMSWVVFAMMIAAGNAEPTMEHLMNLAIGLYDKDTTTARELGDTKCAEAGSCQEGEGSSGAFDRSRSLGELPSAAPRGVARGRGEVPQLYPDG